MRSLLLLVLAASTAAAQSNRPLDARLLPPGRSDLMLVDLNDSAYVAIYAVQRHVAPSLVYYSLVKRGEHRISPQTWIPDPTTWVGYQDVSFAGKVETTLIMVASRTPLDVRRYHDRTAKDDEDGTTIGNEIAQAIAAPRAPAVVDSYVWRY